MLTMLPNNIVEKKIQNFVVKTSRFQFKQW